MGGPSCWQNLTECLSLELEHCFSCDEWYISTVPFHVCLFFTGCHAVGSKEDTEVSWGHCRCKTLYLYALYDICLKYLCECFVSIWMKTGIYIGQSMLYLIWMYCIYNVLYCIYKATLSQLNCESLDKREVALRFKMSKDVILLYLASCSLMVDRML